MVTAGPVERPGGEMTPDTSEQALGPLPERSGGNNIGGLGPCRDVGRPASKQALGPLPEVR